MLKKQGNTGLDNDGVTEADETSAAEGLRVDRLHRHSFEGQLARSVSDRLLYRHM
jgi:hypothetical protein